MLNCLRELWDPSQIATGWRELRPRGETLDWVGAPPGGGMTSELRMKDVFR